MHDRALACGHMIEFVDETNGCAALAREILAILGSAKLSNAEMRVCLLIVDTVLKRQRPGEASVG